MPVTRSVGGHGIRDRTAGTDEMRRTDPFSSRSAIAICAPIARTLARCPPPLGATARPGGCDSSAWLTRQPQEELGVAPFDGAVSLIRLGNAP